MTSIDRVVVVSQVHPVLLRTYTATATATEEAKVIEPPPAGGHLSSISSSKFLKLTREAALKTRGLKWVDEEQDERDVDRVGGRETRKMNVYQAVRDAQR